MTKQIKLVPNSCSLAGKVVTSLVVGSISLLTSFNSAVQAKDIFSMNSQGGWDKVSGCGKDVGIGPSGAIWVVGCDTTQGGNGIYNWQGGSTWRKIYGGAKQVAVNPNGTPVVVNDSGQLFEGDGNGGWKAFPGCAQDVGIGANGALWVVGCNAVNGGYGIYQWTGSGWRGIAGGAVAISVFPNGRPIMVNNADEIFIGDGQGQWQRLDGKAKDISVGANGSLWVIGNNVESNGYGIYKRTGTTWQKIPGSAVRISVNPQGVPWVINQEPVVPPTISIPPLIIQPQDVINRSVDEQRQKLGINSSSSFYGSSGNKFVASNKTGGIYLWCTDYAYGRAIEKGLFSNNSGLGAQIKGNAGAWDNDAGQTNRIPRANSIVVWDPNQGGASYAGHVGFVEVVYPDGSFLISESNWGARVMALNVRHIRPGTAAFNTAKFIY